MDVLFDTVIHNILLSKLEQYGARDVMLDCFESYLSLNNIFQ